MEPMQASRLRAAGWQLPDNLPGEYSFRVYDTRLDTRWLCRLLPELGLAGLPGSPAYFIGGDFLQAPHLQDAEALQPGRLERWGPSGAEAYHLVVLPRPHSTTTWLPRARQQLAIEAAGSWMTMTLVADRNKCPAMWTSTSLLQVLPLVAPILLNRRWKFALRRWVSELQLCGFRPTRRSCRRHNGRPGCWPGTACW